MTRVEEREQRIQELSPEEFAQLRDWLLEQDWADWDRQIDVTLPPGSWTGSSSKL